ncbi:MAG: hypothetical protein AAF253_09025 [Pseudomonadota bacterium]
MAGFEIVEAVNSPGAPGKSGDDRYGFDAAAGTAWVLDGATDVTDLKPFPGAESGAAWIASAFSARLMAAPAPDMAARDYWRDVMADVRQRARGDSTIALASLPPEAWPIASGVWMRRLGGEVELGWMGDCIALDLETGAIHGAADAIARETEESRALESLGEAQRWDAARQSRIATNTSDAPIFGLVPEKASGLSLTRIEARPGLSLVLMSDGFFRLIEPYRIVESGTGLAALIGEGGLAGALEKLRVFEATTPADAIARIKPSDDSCALWVRLN